MHEPVEIPRQFTMRCTRRYSPGVCADHVSPVWTYVFQEQNCTERLGCATFFRANRFKSYVICMRNCRGMAEVYLQMIEGDDDRNQTAPLRKGQKPKSSFTGIRGRKQGTDYLARESGDSDDDYDDYAQVKSKSPHSILYKDLVNNYEVFPHDVDQEDGQIRSQYHGVVNK